MKTSEDTFGHGLTPLRNEVNLATSWEALIAGSLSCILLSQQKSYPHYSQGVRDVIGPHVHVCVSTTSSIWRFPVWVNYSRLFMPDVISSCSQNGMDTLSMSWYTLMMSARSESICHSLNRPTADAYSTWKAEQWKKKGTAVSGASSRCF